MIAGSIDAAPETNTTVVLQGTPAAVFARDARGGDYVLFVRNDLLMAQAFDIAALKTSGEPSIVTSLIGMMGPIPGVSVSDNGILAFTTDTSGGRAMVQFSWFDRSGRRIADAGVPGFYREFTLSADESRIATTVTNRDETDIYVMDAANSASHPVRLTFDRAPERGPMWSPDAKRLIYTRTPEGIFERPVMGTGAEHLVVKPGERVSDWSHDGRTIVYSLEGDIMLLTDGKSSRFRQTPFIEQHARLSPDGSLIAYTSNDSRRVFDVYVETVPAGNGQWLVSDGGFQPRWRADGRELFYIRFADAKLMSVPVAPGPSFGAPVELFPVPTVGINNGFAVSSNGQCFLIPAISASGSSAPFTVKTNWTPAR